MSNIERIAFSVEEVSQKIGSPYGAVLEAIHHKDPARCLAAQKVGKEYRIHRDAIDDWLKQKKCHEKNSRPDFSTARHTDNTGSTTVMRGSSQALAVARAFRMQKKL